MYQQGLNQGLQAHHMHPLKTLAVTYEVDPCPAGEKAKEEKLNNLPKVKRWQVKVMLQAGSKAIVLSTMPNVCFSVCNLLFYKIFTGSVNRAVFNNEEVKAQRDACLRTDSKPQSS